MRSARDGVAADRDRVRLRRANAVREVGEADGRAGAERGEVCRIGRSSRAGDRRVRGHLCDRGGRGDRAKGADGEIDGGRLSAARRRPLDDGDTATRRRGGSERGGARGRGVPHRALVDRDRCVWFRVATDALGAEPVDESGIDGNRAEKHQRIERRERRRLARNHERRQNADRTQNPPRAFAAAAREEIASALNRA